MTLGAKLFTAAGIVGAVAIGGWRVSAIRNPQPVGHAVVILDRSGSTAESESCAGVVGLAAEALVNPALGRGSTLLVLATGNASTVYEPIEVARYEVPTTRRVMEGRRADERRRHELLADLAKRCEGLDRTKVSPVLLAIRRGTEHLRAAGCSASVPCRLYVKTDGRETVEKTVVRALAGRRKAFEQLPPPILADASINVRLYGFSETVGDRDVEVRRKKRGSRRRARAQADHRFEVWQRLIGPSVVIEPYCPKVQPVMSPVAGGR